MEIAFVKMLYTVLQRKMGLKSTKGCGSKSFGNTRMIVLLNCFKNLAAFLDTSRAKRRSRPKTFQHFPLKNVVEKKVVNPSGLGALSRKSEKTIFLSSSIINGFIKTSLSSFQMTFGIESRKSKLS